MSVILGIVGFGAFAHSAWGQTAFGYQGQLKEGGAAANGNYDLTFRLFDAAAGGNLVGPDVPKPNTPVANGLFSTQLDFGVAPWVPNLPRWLEIAVNGQTLSPRLELTSVPSSLNTRGINVDATGNVGVGTAAPAQKLSVVGTVQSTSGGFMFPDGTVQTTAATGGGGFWSANGTHIFKNNTGNVGIGTSAPTESLHLVGNPNRQVVARFDNPGASTGGSWLTTAHTPTGREWSFGVNSSDGGFDFFNTFAFSSVMRIAQGGDLYVQGNLTLAPSGGVSPTLFTGTGASEGNRYVNLINSPQFPSASGLKAGGVLVSDAYAYANPGKNDLVVKGTVGIGVTNPTSRLDIAGQDGLRITGFQPFLTLRDGNAGNARGVIQSVGGDLNFFTNASLATGIPPLKVHNSGVTSVNVIEIRGADLAEKFPTHEEKPEPGTVMEIDPDHAGALRIARQAYSPRVAGVVSGAGDLPVGAVLGNLPNSEDSPAIALSGRVWVRCDAAQEAIQPGDLLTTSDTPGHAMKASDRDRSHGAVLGKAMTVLKKGEIALVLVLVNLQ